MKIKVLVIDDSAIIRGIIKAIINEQPDMLVVGEAPDPLVARDLIRDLKPDVLTLDIEMPNMNGLSFLKRLMRLRPMPVVMLSSHTQEGSDVAFRALAMGAVDFIGKPQAGEAGGEAYANLIADKIRAAHAARDKLEPLELSRAVDAEEVLPMLGNSAATRDKLLVIGAGTGGAEALRDLLAHLPADSPAVLIALDMAASFTKHLARRLADACHLPVKEAEHDEPVLPGRVYVAPGGHHLLVRRFEDRGFGLELSSAPPVNQHRPSVDVLFNSAAEAAGADTIGVILTGMGRDGAAGLLALRRAGAFTLAQDETSSMVYAMPKAAIELDAVDRIVSLHDLPITIARQLSSDGALPGASG